MYRSKTLIFPPSLFRRMLFVIRQIRLRRNWR